ncbi:MAG: CPBP family intramembrane metalloprotease [Planctomyces sp.]|nr:CPBP family intramembrane metalloprotease [Planctomyces sp.]
MAAAFYAALLAATAVIAWAAGVDLGEVIFLSSRGLAIGVIAVAPMLPLYFVAGSLRELVIRVLGGALSRLNLPQLGLLAVLAGVTEECLFRGVLQAWWGRMHPLAGLIGANLVFGLLHAVTPLYFVVATALGFYLSAVADMDESRNLLAPIVTHTLYDFLGFVVIAREFRRRTRNAPDLPFADSDADSGPPLV